MICKEKEKYAEKLFIWADTGSPWGNRRILHVLTHEFIGYAFTG